MSYLGAKARLGERSLHCGKRRCPAAIKLYKVLHYQNNKQDYLDRSKQRDPNIVAQYKKTWKVRNPAKVKADTQRRRSRLERQTPSWLTQEQWATMNEFYFEAKRLTQETGIEHHVDHIHPLCDYGLHVPWNLRVITAQENMTRPRKLSESIGFP